MVSVLNPWSYRCLSQHDLLRISPFYVIFCKDSIQMLSTLINSFLYNIQSFFLCSVLPCWWIDWLGRYSKVGTCGYGWYYCRRITITYELVFLFINLGNSYPPVGSTRSNLLDLAPLMQLLKYQISFISRNNIYQNSDFEIQFAKIFMLGRIAISGCRFCNYL